MAVLNERIARAFLEERGRWQSYQILLCCLGYFTSCLQSMIIVFIGFQPDFTCVDNVEFGNDSIPADVFDNQCESHNSTSNTSTGCTAGFIYNVDKTTSIVSEWDLVCESAYLSETSQLLYTVGNAVGSITTSFVSDKFGRIRTYLVFRIVFVFLSFGVACSPNITCFMIGRFLIGTISMGLTVVMFVQLMEISPARLRPFSTTMMACVWAISLCLMDIVAYLLRNFSWRYIQVALSVPNLFVIFEIIFLKESLLWLYANKREDQASSILENAMETNGLNLEDFIKDNRELTYKSIEETAVDSEDQVQTTTDIKQKERVSILDILLNRSTRVMTLILGFAWFVNSLVYYAIFYMSDSLVWDRYTNFFLSAAVEIPAVALLYISLRCFGRKKPFIGLHIICAVPLLIGGILTVTLNDDTKFIVMQIVATMGKLVISATFNFIYIYTSEVFPTNFRASSVGIGSATARVGSFMAPFAGVMAAAIPWGPGVIFGSLCLVLAILLFWVPETSGTSLPQSIVAVDNLLKPKQGAEDEDSSQKIIYEKA